MAYPQVTISTLSSGLRIGFCLATAFRVDFAVGVLSSVASSLLLVSAWSAIGPENLPGHSLGYIVLSQTVLPLAEAWKYVPLAKRFADGSIGLDTRRPVGYPVYLLIVCSGCSIAASIPAGAILGSGILVAGLGMTGLRPGMMMLAALLFVLGMAFLLVLGICIQMLTYRLVQGQGLIALYRFLIALLGGAYIPLDMAPGPVRSILEYSPFEAAVSGSAQVLVGESSTTVATTWVGVLCVSLGLSVAFCYIIWRTIRNHLVITGG